MKKKESLWDKYCSFYEKDFDEQVEYNRKRRDEFFERWKKTKTAGLLLPKGSDSFEDVPITTYNDYTFLHKFGIQMEKKTANNPKPDGMSWKEYYERMSVGLKDWIADYLPGEYGVPVKTTGTTGRPKWFAVGKKFIKEFGEEMMSTIIFACSDDRGETKIDRGDIVLNMGIPIPYLGGYTYRAWGREFTMFPSIQFTDEELNMKAKLRYILKKIKHGQEIHCATGVASTFYLFGQTIVKPEKVYEDYYKTSNFGIKKMIGYLLYQKEKLKKNKVQRVKDVLPIKGSVTSGIDTMLYKDYITYHFGSPPLNAYGSTELGMVMMGRTDRKLDLVPNLRLRYVEFVDLEGNIHAIDDLKKGRVYQLIGTPFDTPLIRYDQKDLLLLKEFRDDGMPIFTFEGRKESWLNLNGYFYLTEGIAFHVMKKAGFENDANWAVTKKVHPDERLYFLYEKNLDEGELTKKLYSGLYEISEDFRRYVDDFDIKKPSEIIEVEKLSRGSFKRYAMEQMDKDIPIGQYKSPKIISPEDKEIVEDLRRA